MTNKVDLSNKFEAKGAWLVTWEYAGDWHLAKRKGLVTKKVVAILNHRKSGKTVSDIVEQLFMSERYSIFEKIMYAKNRERNPYIPTFGTINGISVNDGITCGHNPYLYARYVRNLQFFTDNEGNQQLTWEEGRWREIEEKVEVTWHKCQLVEPS